jgi:TPP-dependent indolepyruvate ferredoxin oxidoreductase alpha subunit
MSDDEFEAEPELDEEDLDEETLVEDEFEDDDDDLVEDVEEVEVLVVEDVVPVVEPVVEEETAEEDDDIVDLDEELHPDDVEEALDVVLRERTAKVGLEDEDEEEDEPDDRGEGTRIVPRRDNEFLCRSCFLVLPRHQLADEERMLCRDCA